MYSRVSKHIPNDDAAGKNCTSVLSWDMKRKSRDRAAPPLFSSLNLALWFTHHLARTFIRVVICFFCFFNMQGAQGVQGYPGENGPQGPPGTSVSMNLCLTCYFNLLIFKVTKRITWPSQTSWCLETWICEIHTFLHPSVFFFLLIIYYARSLPCFQKCSCLHRAKFSFSNNYP